jgi:superkiller protein 3
MPPDQRQSLDPGHKVDRILAQYHISQGHIDEALKVVQNAVNFKAVPGAAKRNLSEFLIQQGNSKAVEVSAAALKSASDRNELSSLLRITSIARAKLTSIDAAVQKDAERALVLAPWELSNRLALAYVRCKLQKDS